MIENARKNREGQKCFLRIFHRKNVFQQKISFFAIRLLYMFMHTKYHGGTPQTRRGENSSKLCIFIYGFSLFWTRIGLIPFKRAGDRKSSKLPDFPIC